MSAGANVRVSANSSPYQQALKAARDSTKLLASEFSLASTQAKLFGSATDQLKAKQQELTAKITAQKQITSLHNTEVERLTKTLDDQKNRQQELGQQLQATKAAYEVQKKATGEDSESTQELAKQVADLEKKQKTLDSQITSTEGKLQKATIAENNSKKATLELEKALEQTNKQLRDTALDNFKSKLDGAAGSLEKLQPKANAISAAVVGTGVAAGKSAMDFEDAFAKTKTIMDEQEVGYEDMKSAIMDLSDQTGVSAATIAEDVYNAISAGRSTGEAVDFLRSNMNLARAGFADTGQSLDLLTTILNAYGDKAYDVNTISDMLIQTQNKGKTTVAELAASMGTVIPIANSTNTQLDQLSAAYAIMTARGIGTAETTTYLKSMLNELSAAGTDTDKILREQTGQGFAELMESGKSLGDVLEILNDYGQKNNVSLKDMFGSVEAGSAALTLCAGGAGDFNQMLDTMRSSTGTTDSALEKLDTRSRQIQISLNQAKNAGIELGDALMSRAGPFIDAATEKIKSATEWFKSLDDSQKDNVISAGLYVAALAPALAGLTGLVKGISSAVTAYKTVRNGISAVVAALTSETAAKAASTAATAAHTVATGAATVAQNGLAAAQAALNAVMNANPIILVVTAIAALAAGLVLAYQNCESFRNAVNSAVEGAKQAFEGLKAKVSEAMQSAGEAFGRFADQAKLNFDRAKQSLQETTTNIQTKMQEIGQTISTKWEEVKTKSGEIWQGIKQTVSGKLQEVQQDNQQKLDAIKQAYESHGGGVSGIVAAYLETIKQRYTTAYNALNTLTGGKFGEMLNTVTSKMEGIRQQAANALQNIQSNTQQRLASILQAYNSHGGGLRGVVAAYMEAIRQTYQGAYDAINSLTGGRFGNIVNTIQNAMNNAKNAVSSAINQIRGFFNFSWSLPHLAMPHPYVRGSFSLNPPSVPSFGIDWYATGGIMQKPTAFGINGSRLMVGGEAGAEAILPLAPFYAQLEQMLDDKVTAALRAMRVEVHVVNQLDGDDLSAKVTSRVSSALADEAERIR